MTENTGKVVNVNGNLISVRFDGNVSMNEICYVNVDDKKLKRAGLDYWYLLDITYYDTMEEFFEKNQGGNFFYFSTKAQKRHSDVSYPDNTYLVFGKETAGLPEDLLFANADKCVRIPMIDEARSLNLSNAVAIGVYETLRQWDYPQLLESGELRNYNWSDQ